MILTDMWVITLSISNLYCEVIAPLTRLYAHPKILDRLKNFMLLLYPEVRTDE
jgi:hypothetical protein